MKVIKCMSKVLLTALLVVSLTGCGDTKDDDSFTGFFNLGITDAPLDEVSRVVVQFTGIEMQTTSGRRLTFDFETPQQIDLLTLRDGGREFLLTDKALPAGYYDWLRLKVDAEPDVLDSYIELMDGTTHSLTIPSGSQTDLKLVRCFEIPLGGIADFTIDFDLRQSIHTPSESDDDYLMRPVLRMVDNAEIGKIAGIVDPIFINDPDDPACTVYIFKGADVTPDDIDGLDAEPITTAFVKLDEDSGQYVYQADFLNAGDYTLALTHQSKDDDPETDDEINFVIIASHIGFSAGGEIRYDFHPYKSVSFGAEYPGSQ